VNRARARSPRAWPECRECCDPGRMDQPSAPADRAWGAFTDDTPWVLDRDTSAGSRSPHASAVRRTPRCRCSPSRRRCRPARESSRWCAPRRRRGAVDGAQAARRYATPEASRADISRRLRQAAETLGPTYIKLGQIISSGEGLFPAELVSEFKLCRDQVPAEPFDVVRTVVEGDLGGRLEDLFQSFETTPLAAASIAQVHAAVLRTGEEVVVKVQRPSVAGSCARTCASWRGSRRTSSAASRSPRWPTRRRSSSCSPRRSSRSSTSGWRPRT
jgi:ubiquinone biosynthesis protein